MTQRRQLLPLSFVIAAACAACGESPPSPAETASFAPQTDDAAPSAALPKPTRAPSRDAIAGWLRGEIDAAFATAHAESKPVLLYWGAEWCPYCADLEAHVFSRDDVARKLSLLVPVYLDGDDAGAQRWAEIFGVAGYPTVLALAPDRTELARIAGGMPLEVYAEMLDLVLGDVRPLDDVLAAARSARLSENDCRRLAYNGWGLEDASDERALDLAAALEKAADACAGHMPVESARLTVAAAAFAVQSTAESPDAIAWQRRLVRGVREIVTDPERSVAIADALRELGDEYFSAAKTLEPEHTRDLLEAWTHTMDEAARDARFSPGDRLAALRSKMQAFSALDPTGVPASLAADARRAVDETLGEVGASPARRGAVNGAINLLVALGDIESAYAIAENELASSRTPYYHMADLAWLDEMMGRYGAAIAWLERAYRASSGPATRFQWGVNWVRGLLRMFPEDEAAIRDAALDVLGELEGPDKIYRRTRARLETLDESLREWAAEPGRDDTLDALRRRMSSICDGIPEHENDALASCKAFLAVGAQHDA